MTLTEKILKTLMNLGLLNGRQYLYASLETTLKQIQEVLDETKGREYWFGHFPRETSEEEKKR